MARRKRQWRAPRIDAYWSVDGVDFTHRRTPCGIQAHSADGRLIIGRNNHGTYFAMVDGHTIGSQFHTETSAVARAVRAMKRNDRAGVEAHR